MATITLNGVAHPIASASATIGDLVRTLNLEGKRVAVEMNGEIVPKSRYRETAIGPGDRLEIVAAVGGG